MAIHIKTVGVLLKILPEGRTVITGENITLQDALYAIVEKHGLHVEDELFINGELRPGLFILVNGRNVRLLPHQYGTIVKDGDEILISVLVTGG